MPPGAPPHEARDLDAGRVERLARLRAQRVAGRRIADARLEEGAHDGEDPRVHGREARVVEVDAPGLDPGDSTGIYRVFLTRKR